MRRMMLILTSADKFKGPKVALKAFRCTVQPMSNKTPSKKRAVEAAEQMWKALCMGNTFEVPASLSTDDLTTQAILILRKKHPEVLMNMLQSKGVVFTLGKPSAVGAGAWGVLAQNGYFPEPQLAPELFLASHAKFMRQTAHIDPEQAVKLAQREHAKRNAISVGKR